MSPHRSSWKRRERDTARMFGTRRQQSLGSCGRANRTRSDSTLDGLFVDAARMRANLELTHGALFSQAVLLALVERGLARDEAYRIVQELAQRALDERIDLRELLAADRRVATLALDLDALFDYEHYVRHAEEIVGRLDALIGAPAGI